MKASVRRSADWKDFALLITLIVALVGCGAGKTLVMKPAEISLQVSSIDVIEGNSAIDVPEDVRKAFQERLNKLLYEEGNFQRGPDLKIKYRFVQYNPGNQFTRWFWGGIGNAGEGSMTIEAKYFDTADKELATIQAEGKIGSGFFGGSFDFAVEKAAREIAEYTKQNFKRR